MKTAYDVLKNQDHETLKAISTALGEDRDILETIKSRFRERKRGNKRDNFRETKTELNKLKIEKSRLETEARLYKQKAQDNNETGQELTEIERMLSHVT
eukprot:UN01459